MEEDDTNVFGVDPEDLEDVEELLLNDFDIEDSTGCLKKMLHSDLILWGPTDTFLFLPWYLVHLYRIPGYVLVPQEPFLCTYSVPYSLHMPLNRN